MIINNLKKLIGINGFSREEYGYLCVYLVTFIPLIYKFISPFFIIMGLGDLTILINPIIMITGLIIIRKRLLIYIRPSDVILYIVVSGLLLLTPLLFPANNTFFEQHYADFVLFIMSYYFVGLTLDYSQRHRVFSAVAKIGVWYMIYWQTLLYLGIVETNSYDDTTGEQMGQAYLLLFSVLVLFMDVFSKPRLIDIVYLIVSTLLLLFMGARGPILIFAIFIVIYLLLFHKFKSYNVFKKIVVVLFGMTFIFYLKVIIMAIIPIASSLGFSTRVFDSILDGRMMDISESSGRDDIWNILTKAIEDDFSGLGYGWLGDRLLLPDGIYSHNFELEILVQFGVIIGGGILLLLLVLLFKSYYQTKKSSSRKLWLLMLFVGLVELQLSKTYITHNLLFVMIGYYMSVKRQISQ